MTMPLSIRFTPDVVARLKSRAIAETGANTSALAARLVDEGLRMADHPGVMFKPVGEDSFVLMRVGRQGRRKPKR